MEGTIALEALVRSTLLFIGIFGALVGIDLVLGAKVITNLKRFLDKSLHIDHIIISANPRMIVGILFLIFSLVMIIVIRRP